MCNNIIYGLKDPRTDEYRYVGKSINGIKRAKSHFTHSHNPLITEWIKELKLSNFTPDIVILENVFDWTLLLDKEKYWIKKLIEEEYNLFNILNINSNNLYEVDNETYNYLLNEKYKNNIFNENLNKKIIQINTKSDIISLIKDRRKLLNVTQEQLSEISEIGIATIKRFELNKFNITIDNLVRILDILGLVLTINIKK